MRFNHSRQTESTSTGRRVHDDTDAAEPDDDIGIVAALSAVPPDALGAMFEASPDAFRNIPHNKQHVVIARKPGFAAAERKKDHG